MAPFVSSSSSSSSTPPLLLLAAHRSADSASANRSHAHSHVAARRHLSPAAALS
jgi:hypothetical protein